MFTFHTNSYIATSNKVMILPHNRSLFLALQSEYQIKKKKFKVNG